MKKNKLIYLVVTLILITVSFFGISKVTDNIYKSEKLVFNENNTTELSEQSKYTVGNYYLVKDNWILGKFSKIIQDDKMQIYADAINTLSNNARTQNKDVYFISMTHKTNMLKRLYPDFVMNKENIDLNKQSFKSKLDKNNISFIDIDGYFLSNFTESQREKFYFKTDHHWNGLGAFEGFKFMINNVNLGLSNDTINSYLDGYRIKEVKEKEFLGSYNRKLNLIVKEKEFANYVYRNGSKLEYYICDGYTDKKISEKNIMATLRKKDSWDYGGAYMRGTNCNILKIRNKNSLSDKKVLVFRDSYQAPMTWLLADVFKEVEIIDPRYIENIDMTYEDMIVNSKSDIVMFMYNSFGFEGMIKEMIEKGIE